MTSVTETKMGPTFPADYQKVFADHYMRIDQLPVLDLKGRQGSTDYIDFIRPGDMTAPVMRYKDRFNRLGLALHLRCTYGEWKDKEVVFAPFQRYTGNSKWTFGWGGSQSFVERAYQAWHEKDHGDNGIMACPTCPMVGSRVKPEQLQAILTGTDPVVKLCTRVTVDVPTKN